LFLGLIIWTYFVFDQQHLFCLAGVPAVLDAFSFELFNESAVGFHCEFDFFDDVFWGDVAGPEGEDDFSFGVV